MKRIYIITFFTIVAIVLIISLYMLEIPAPSTLVREEFNIIIE